MSDISELESRITSALDRIARGLEGLDASEDTQDATQEVERLTQALEEERTLTAQLEERVKAIKDKLDARVQGLDKAMAEARASVTAMDTELQQLRDVNEKLRASNVALRDANAAGLADADLINTALQTELEALRASRAADAAEVSAVLGQLDAILGNDAKQEDA